MYIIQSVNTIEYASFWFVVKTFEMGWETTVSPFLVQGQAYGIRQILLLNR